MGLLANFDSPNYYRYYSVILVLRGAPNTADTVPEFHVEAPQATVSELLAPYIAARAGVEPMTLRTKGVNSNNVPHTPHNIPNISKKLTF